MDSDHPNEADFQRLAQTIATSIQKILQNGKNLIFKVFTVILIEFNYSFLNAENG